nr:PREDICTED: probable E3 ubiquitin-protein ligase RHB1A [Raphanus sativus]
MGGCCSSSSSRHPHLVGTPIYYYCPESFGEFGPSGARAGVGSAAALTTTGLLSDIIGLETSSIPNTFYAPAPLPYDLLFGIPDDSESIKGKISDISFETCKELEGLDCKTQPSSVILSPSESDLSKQKTWNNQLVDEEEEEDSCPICFEFYEAENPKIKTNCEHDFHLSCILEWMERSDGCPICDKNCLRCVAKTKIQIRWI